MNVALTQSQIAAQVAAYGETLTVTQHTTSETYTLKAFVAAVTNANVSTLATAAGGGGGLTLAGGGGVPAETETTQTSTTESGTTTTTATTNYEYPALAVMTDGLQPTVFAPLDTFERDGVTLTVQVVYSHRLADDALLWVALAVLL